jgi:methionyl-tRNA formyltransferase
MARIIVIGGIESTYTNAQVLHELGEDIVMFYTRGPHSPGWEGVGIVDETHFSFAAQVPRTMVNGHIRDHVHEMQALAPDLIYSLGWQQMYSKDMLELCPVVGIHESLLPRGAGAVPIANAILHDEAATGITLFRLDAGVDTGTIIGQLKGTLSPLTANATELYREAMDLGGELLRMFVPHINRGTAPSIPQDVSRRVVYRKVDWSLWPEDKVRRARVYPYA